MNENLTFVHLTDLHVGDPNVPDAHLYSDTNATMRTILAQVKAEIEAIEKQIRGGSSFRRSLPGTYCALGAQLFSHGYTLYSS